jgi:hypothetical protein
MFPWLARISAPDANTLSIGTLVQHDKEPVAANRHANILISASGDDSRCARMNGIALARQDAPPAIQLEPIQQARLSSASSAAPNPVDSPPSLLF